MWLVVMDTVIFENTDAARIGLAGAAIVASLILALARNVSIQTILSPVAWVLAAVAVALQTNGVVEGTLVRPDELAPLQGWIVALLFGSVALAVPFAIAATMVQLINPHTGFNPYVTHAAWAGWFFLWMILIWWLIPLMVTEGWEYYTCCLSPSVLFSSS